MTPLSICAGLALVGIVLLAFYLSRRPAQPRVPAIGTQRMCPHCGRITPRAKSACLECGRLLAT